VVSNRLPFRVDAKGDGKPVIRPSSGGLVTAMSPLLQERGIAGKWFGWAGAGEEEGLDEALRTRSSTDNFEVGTVSLTKEEIQRYYLGYSNEVLAAVLSDEPDMVEVKKAIECWPVYSRVQAKYARAIFEDLRPADIVCAQDYHLMGLGSALRVLGSQHLIGFFLHMPFPRKKVWRTVPQFRLLLRQLLAYDIIGFQIGRFQSNFVDAVREYLPEAAVQIGPDGIASVSHAGRKTLLGSFPISIDVVEFERQLYQRSTQVNIRRLKEMVDKGEKPKIVFNVGRLDPKKGFLQELRAFKHMLEQHPDLVGKVLLYQLIIPNKGEIKANREYKEEVLSLARAINETYGLAVKQAYTHMSRNRYLAYLHIADVQDVPTMCDGMNLVAKESAIVGNPLTVTVLGKNAGVAEEFAEHAIIVDPKDTERYADALYVALTMKAAERRRRKSQLKAIVTGNDVFHWWSGQQEQFFQRLWSERFGA